MLISVSDLAAYVYCPRKLFNERVLGITAAPSPRMTLGSVKHAVFQHANLVERRVFMSFKEGMTAEDVHSLFLDAYKWALEWQLKRKAGQLSEQSINPSEAFSSLLPVLDAEAGLRASAVHKYALTNGCYGFDLWQSVVPKIFSEVRVRSRELSLRGAIDRIELFPDRCITYELKSGSPPSSGVWPWHRMQVAAYSLLAQRRFNVPAKQMAVEYISSGEKRELAMNPFLQQEVTSTTAKVLSLLESKEPPSACGRKSCSCG
ncbi:PD-(D/E)XK nuclease family protein [Candidatus Woesearchaeota archaeon]|nr:PD-(D/E)XK nuclease family protein [Candidatus Woesearchaeota archaeon]